jgi:protein-S-isoprenylcysteine O-methyltransferase Ste14
MSDGFFQRGGWWVVGQFMLMLAVAILGFVHRDESKHIFLFLCGVIFLTASVLCGISGGIALGRNLTPFPKPSAGAQFVQRGIYGLMRHPLYTAVICASVGWSLIRSRPFRQAYPNARQYGSRSGRMGARCFW